MEIDNETIKVNLFQDIFVINIGIEEFFNALIEQNIPVIQVDWNPEKLNDDEINGLLSVFL